MNEPDLSQVALDAVKRDDALLDLIEQGVNLHADFAAAIAQLHAELAELRDGMVALSNRIEAATRSTVTGGTLLHSVKVDRREP